MPDDQTKLDVGLGLGLGVLGIGLLVLFRKCFAAGGAPQPQPPPQPQPAPPPPIQFPPGVTGYGFAWQNGVALQIRALTAQEPAGVYVAVGLEAFRNPAGRFLNPLQGVGVVYPLEPVSAAFQQTMQPVTTDDQLLKQVEGFLRYVHHCLTYINATIPGAALLAALAGGQRKICITPAPQTGNSTAGAGPNFVTRCVRHENMDLTDVQRQQLIGVLEQASGQQGQAAYTWLANQINQMPLYSLFEQSNPYPPAFLTTNQETVTAQGLQDWFTHGRHSAYAAVLQNRPPVAGVSILNFVRNAVIVSLYPRSPAGASSDSDVFFDARDYARNAVDMPVDFNSPTDRPPAIGLAHELVHALHNMRGTQPGRDVNDPTTTLTELLCVGIGPWANPVNGAITENIIRAAWPPAPNIFPVAHDPLNLRAVAPRTIYDDPGPAGAAAARTPGRAI